MSVINKGDVVRVWPGLPGEGHRNYLATVLSDVTVFGDTPCYRVRKLSGGTDFMAVTHTELVARVEGRTAYVQTAKDALEVCDWDGLDDVVIEDNMERIKMQKLMKGFS